MAGPTEQRTNTVFIPPGEGRQTFAPLPLAWVVENLEVGADGVLESVVGPSILRIKSQVFVTTDDVFEGTEVEITDAMSTSWPVDVTDYGLKSGEPCSVFSAKLLNGSATMLLYRIGSRLYTFNGGHDNPDDILLSGLTVNPNSPHVDQYVVVNDQIIYFNGVDRPQVITPDNSTTPLGFDFRAATPSVSSPSQPDFDDAANYFPHSMGYC